MSQKVVRVNVAGSAERTRHAFMQFLMDHSELRDPVRPDLMFVVEDGGELPPPDSDADVRVHLIKSDEDPAETVNCVVSTNVPAALMVQVVIDHLFREGFLQ